MKKAIGITVIVAGILISGCDRVALPVPVNQPSGVCGTTGARVVLLEHFVGHLCAQCGMADDSVESLMNSYPGFIVPVSVHAGFFALDAASPSAPLPTCAASNPGSFTTDFRTAAGNSIDSLFNATANGIPVGMISRSNHLSNQHLVHPAYWRDSVIAMLQRPQEADVSITVNYNTSTRMMDVDVAATAFQNLNSASGFALNVVLTEDSITDWFNTINTCVPNYQFNHVLRAAVNSNIVTGSSVSSGNLAASQTVTQSFNGFYVQPQWNENHCHVVAYLFNKDTHEVVQAAMMRVH